MAGPATTDQPEVSGEPDVVSIVTRVAIEEGVDPRLALAVGKQESGLDPTNIGDNGHSVGIFQLNDEGEGAGMSIEERQDPETNARIAIRQIAAVQREHPDWSPGEIAVAAQRPAEEVRPSYIANVNTMVSSGGPITASSPGGSVSMQSSGAVSGVPAGSVQDDAGLSPEEYFRKNYGYEAWVLDVPELKTVLLPLLDQRADAGKIQAALESTQWWQTHSVTQRQFTDLEARDPAQAQAKLAQAQAQIEVEAQRVGVQIAPDRLSSMARDAAQFGWDVNQLRLAVQHETSTTPVSGGLIDASTMQVKALGAKYFMPIDNATAATWGRNIANGTASLQGFAQWASQQASASRPDLAPQLGQGLTMDDILSTHRQQIANTLEMDPNSIDFVNNPRWQKIMDYVPPGETQRRMMTIPEALSYARSQPEYRTTKQANDQADSMALNIAKTFGKVA